MNGLEMEPSACTWCGIAQRGHGRQYADAVGWHEWEQPSQEQMLARMKARRLQLAVTRTGALPMPAGPVQAELERLETRIAELKEQVAALEAQGQALRGSRGVPSPEGEFHSFLHHAHTTPHDLPPVGGA